MVTVSHVVGRILEGMPFLEEALVKGIINYAYLAEMIKPDVEREMRKGVKRSAIVMAIRRFGETLNASEIKSTSVNLKGADVTMRSGIFEITVVRDNETIESIHKLYGVVDLSKGDVLTVTQGLYEITILSNSKYREQMARLFSRGKVVKITDGLASIMVKIPQEAADSVGVLYLLVKSLSWNNVNIVEVVSTLTEEIFIIREDDTPIAFSAIKDLIKQSE